MPGSSPMLKRVSLPTATAAVHLLFAATAFASEPPPPSWGSICSELELAEEAEKRVSAASRCALALERIFGPDDRRLVGHFSEIAERLSAGGGVSAGAALPYRRRAHRAAMRLYGQASPEAGGAALRYARAKILAGRCEPQSAEALDLLNAAASGMRAADGAARLSGMRDVARGFADSLAFKQATALLLEAGGADGAALSVGDWERIGVWRTRVGDAAAAVDAFRRALRLDPPQHDRLRIRQSLRQALYEAGDFEGLRALP